MAEYINREELLESIRNGEGTGLQKLFADLCVRTAKNADVIDVVRCKGCKHSFFVKSCSKYECKKGCGTLKYSNDFCSYGERKEE